MDLVLKVLGIPVIYGLINCNTGPWAYPFLFIIKELVQPIIPIETSLLSYQPPCSQILHLLYMCTLKLLGLMVSGKAFGLSWQMQATRTAEQVKNII
jgi:hypothetical protein